MPASKLGRSKDLDKYWFQDTEHQNDGRIRITSISRNSIHSINEITSYPYDGQIVISGSFEYLIPGRNRDDIARSGRYEYRSGSGLLLIDVVSDRPSSDEVFSEINHSVSGQAKVQNALSINRHALWKFFKHADDIRRLLVKGPDGKYDMIHLIRLLSNDDPLSVLHDVSHLDSHEKSTLAPILERIDHSHSINSIDDVDIDLYQNIIEEGKAVYRYNGQFASIEFRRGKLKVDSPGSAAREYVLQLFERDVLSPLE